MTFERAVARLLRQPEGARQPYLFVLDSSGLLGSLTELAVGCRRVPAITYHNDLQLRDSLEPYREQSDGPAPAVAMLFCRDPSGSRAIVDMARRARVVSVTPQAMLEAAGPDSDWHDEFDALSAEHFRALFSAILASRSRFPGSLSRENALLLIGEAILGTPLAGDADAGAASEAAERAESDDVRRLLDRYPRVRRAVEGRLVGIQSATSVGLLDPEMSTFAWTIWLVRRHSDNPDLLLPDFFGRSIWERWGHQDLNAMASDCERTVEQQPERAIAMVRSVERFVSSHPHRERLLTSLLGLDGPRAGEQALKIAAAETVSSLVTEKCLRVLMPRLAAPARPISRAKLARVITTLRKRHLQARFPQYYPRLRHAVQLFGWIADLSEHVAACAQEEWLGDAPILPIERWLDELYPTRIAPMQLLCERIESHAPATADFVEPRTFELIVTARDILRRADRAFYATVRRSYVGWVARHAPPPLLTVDFVGEVLLPSWRALRSTHSRGSCLICIVNDAGWSEWQAVSQTVGALLRGYRQQPVRSLLALLPSERERNTQALMLGRFPTIADTSGSAHLLADRLSREAVPVVGIGVTGSADAVPEGGVGIVELTFDETGGRKTMPTGQGESRLREHVTERLTPLLAGLPRQTMVIVLSNGGTTRPTSQEALAARSSRRVRDRYAEILSADARSPIGLDCAVFSANAIHMSGTGVDQYVFAPVDGRLSLDAADSSQRPIRGGISLAEMVVPCAIYMPGARAGGPSNRTTASRPRASRSRSAAPGS